MTTSLCAASSSMETRLTDRRPWRSARDASKDGSGFDDGLEVKSFQYALERDINPKQQSYFGAVFLAFPLATLSRKLK